MTKIVVTSFNSGEVTPDIDARSDIEKFAGGCRRLENMIPDVFGNATRRPGTELIVIGNGSGCYFELTADPAKVQITTPQELQDMENDLSGDYELMNNIDMAGFNWTPVGPSIAVPFTGSLDGNFFTISNLSLTSSSRVGMFGRLTDATVEKLLLFNFEIHCKGNAGCLAAVMRGNTTIYRVGVTGNIFMDQDLTFGGSFVGGLLEGTSVIGGTGSVTECWALVNITYNYSAFNDDDIGGLIGDLVDLPVTDCWSGGNQIAKGSFDSYASVAGGLIGDHNSASNPPTRCFSYGGVNTSGTQEGDKFPGRVGGFIGRKTLGTVDCFWDTESSTLTWGTQGTGPPDDAPVSGLTGKTQAEMFQQATYTNFDFDTVWEIDEGNGYPTLRWVSEEANIKQVCKRV